MPISAIVGLAATSIIWIIILITQPYSRWVGIVWMVVGLLIYYLYRRKEHLTLTHKEKKTGEVN